LASFLIFLIKNTQRCSIQTDPEYPKLKKSPRLGKFNPLIVKTSQVFKTLKVWKTAILGQPV